MATIDLQCLLYKYETDIAWAIKNIFNDDLPIPDGYGPPLANTSDYWAYKASIRKDAVNKFCWNDKSSMFHDYNTARKEQTPYESATTFWALWSGLASQAQAEKLVSQALPKFEEVGGVLSTLKQPTEVDGSGPAQRQRQWDHPFGWAPHQMLIWDGLIRYGYTDAARRLAYKWLFLLTQIAVDNNGMITERYDVTRWKLGTDDVVEYGNQGVDFVGVPMEGYVLQYIGRVKSSTNLSVLDSAGRTQATRMASLSLVTILRSTCGKVFHGKTCLAQQMRRALVGNWM